MDTLSIHMTETLWMVKLNFLKVSINKANLSITNHMHTLHRILTNNHDPIICTVSNNQKVLGQFLLLLYADDLPGILEILALCIFDFLSFSLSSFSSIQLHDRGCLFTFFKLEGYGSLMV
jgi:hypothetical protein